jgi:hypothetical protein
MCDTRTLVVACSEGVKVKSTKHWKGFLRHCILITIFMLKKILNIPCIKIRRQIWNLQPLIFVIFCDLKCWVLPAILFLRKHKILTLWKWQSKLKIFYAILSCVKIISFTCLVKCKGKFIILTLRKFAARWPPGDRAVTAQWLRGLQSHSTVITQCPFVAEERKYHGHVISSCHVTKMKVGGGHGGSHPLSTIFPNMEISWR